MTDQRLKILIKRINHIKDDICPNFDNGDEKIIEIYKQDWKEPEKDKRFELFGFNGEDPSKISHFYIENVYEIGENNTFFTRDSVYYWEIVDDFKREWYERV